MLDLPSFSIVIPTFGRPDSLRECLRSLAGLDYPLDLVEAIVVEDGTSRRPISPDSLRSVAGSLEVRHIRQDHAGPAVARNRGAEAARNTYLAFTDDDCRPDPGWLRGLARQFAVSPDAILGGRTENDLNNNSFSAASQLLVEYVYEHHLRTKRPFFASNNLAVEHRVFARIGGFDDRFPIAGGEDREFCDKCLHREFGMVFVPDAVIRHHHPLSPRRFFRQHFNYGRGAFIHHQTRATRGGGKIRLEPLSFYIDLLRYPYTARCKRRTLFVSSLMLLSQIANALGFYSEKLLPRTTDSEVPARAEIASPDRASRGP
ncbi:MAG: glycosyltransferase [Planctomycetota bacterium]